MNKATENGKILNRGMEKLTFFHLGLKLFDHFFRYEGHFCCFSFTPQKLAKLIYTSPFSTINKLCFWGLNGELQIKEKDGEKNTN